jgi:hypothetical protein
VNNIFIKCAASSQSSLAIYVLPTIQMVPAFLIRVEDERLQVHKRTVACPRMRFCHVSLNFPYTRKLVYAILCKLVYFKISQLHSFTTSGAKNGSDHRVY